MIADCHGCESERVAPVPGFSGFSRTIQPTRASFLHGGRRSFGRRFHLPSGFCPCAGRVRVSGQTPSERIRCRNAEGSRTRVGRPVTEREGGRPKFPVPFSEPTQSRPRPRPPVCSLTVSRFQPGTDRGRRRREAVPVRERSSVRRADETNSGGREVSTARERRRIGGVEGAERRSETYVSPFHSRILYVYSLHIDR